jgi:hypothetical protein
LISQDLILSEEFQKQGFSTAAICMQKTKTTLAGGSVSIEMFRAQIINFGNRAPGKPEVGLMGWNPGDFGNPRIHFSHPAFWQNFHRRVRLPINLPTGEMCWPFRTPKNRPPAPLPAEIPS